MVNVEFVEKKVTNLQITGIGTTCNPSIQHGIKILKKEVIQQILTNANSVVNNVHAGVVNS
jgi:hypothetical protein